eukprot:RCo027026
MLEGEYCVYVTVDADGLHLKFVVARGLEFGVDPAPGAQEHTLLPQLRGRWIDSTWLLHAESLKYPTNTIGGKIAQEVAGQVTNLQHSVCVQVIPAQLLVLFSMPTGHVP